MIKRRPVAFQLVLCLLACFCCMGSINASEGLSIEAQDFIKKAKEDLSGFYFKVQYLDYGKKTHLNLTLWSKSSKIKRKGGILLDETVILKIIEHLAVSGLIDNQSQDWAMGLPMAGWNIYTGTGKVSAFWHLGRDRDAFSKSKDMQEIRKLLDAKAQEIWDQLLKATKADNQ